MKLKIHEFNTLQKYFESIVTAPPPNATLCTAGMVEVNPISTGGQIMPLTYLLPPPLPPDFQA
jgi:hypothetical protein